MKNAMKTAGRGRVAPVAGALAAMAFGLAMAGPAAAVDCSNAGTQADINECAVKALANDDKTLNAKYQELLGRLGDLPDTAAALKDAQRAWIKFRDAECTFASSGVAGGSIQPMVVADCQRIITEERIEAFDVYLNCAEGDTTCPVPPK